MFKIEYAYKIPDNSDALRNDQKQSLNNKSSDLSYIIKSIKSF